SIYQEAIARFGALRPADTSIIEPANFTLQLGDRCKNFWRRSSQPLRKPVQPTTRQPERRE
ncbi:hypothetical protein, partial [Serratia marcescens]|uniref:hypothetical protein n=1 Tax=Serratia marcescens TaxID=615 RepID=UPI0027E400AB